MSAEQPIEVFDAELGAPDEAEPPADAADAVDINGVSDVALRQALEFAVGIAAAGQKQRPPLVYPSGLKAYLRFNRLDRTSLRAVRRVIAADESFRARLGAVATADMVDELGIAWLRRPEGWQETVRALQQSADAAAEQQSSEAALRRAERRREAAEQAAARAAAELLGHHDAMSREQARRERAEASARSAASEAAARRQEVGELRREIEKVKQRLAVEVERADRAEQQLRDSTEQRRKAEQMRDEALTRLANRDIDAAQAQVAALPAPPPPEPARAAANEVAAKALVQAAEATRQLAEALVEAGRALGDADSAIGAPSAAQTPLSGHHVTEVRRGDHPLAGVRPLRPRPVVRKPIAIPGGVYGNSLAAATHLLRTPDAVVLVDGYNVAKLAWPAMDVQEQRERCIEMLEDLARRYGIDVRAVFDGADVVGASAGRRLIRVQYSPGGVSADDVIRAEVRALPITTPVVVVTNDQAIISDVRANGANPVSSDMLLATCGRSSAR